jgi:hypothetical protein
MVQMLDTPYVWYLNPWYIIIVWSWGRGVGRHACDVLPSIEEDMKQFSLGNDAVGSVWGAVKIRAGEAWE